MATDAENRESAGFNFGRQSDSTYKFTKIRKNLDLFVMERNERHLTSLHWNWQKLSKNDGGGDDDGDHNHNTNAKNPFNSVISPKDSLVRQSAPKLRSRAESRHMLHEIPPGVAHEDIDMYVDDNDNRLDSPYVTPSISEKIRAIKSQLSELNEEIDCKSANRDMDLEADLDEPELTPIYIISKSAVGVIEAAHPDDCIEIKLDKDERTYYRRRSADGYLGLHGELVDERLMRRNSSPTMQQKSRKWKNSQTDTELPYQICQVETAPKNNKCSTSEGRVNEINLEDESIHYTKNSEGVEYSPTVQESTRHNSVFYSPNHHQPLESRKDERYRETSRVSSRKTVGSIEFRPTYKEAQQQSREYKVSDSPEIRRSLPFCRHSMDSVRDSTISMTNVGFRRSGKRIQDAARKTEMEEIFPESEKDSGCQPGDGRESTSTLWRSSASTAKKNESHGKRHGMDSAVSVSQVRNRFVSDDKYSHIDVIDDVEYDKEATQDSFTSIPKPLIQEKDDGTISEISEDFPNEEEKEKFSNNDSSEIWTEKRTASKRSLLEGLGTSYCVLPNFVWKYIGQDTDDEPMTRKKCVAFILGAILAILLLAILLGLIIGLATSSGGEEPSPLRFTVIPGIPDGEENVVDEAPE